MPPTNAQSGGIRHRRRWDPPSGSPAFDTRTATCRSPSRRQGDAAEIAPRSRTCCCTRRASRACPTAVTGHCAIRCRRRWSSRDGAANRSLPTPLHAAQRHAAAATIDDTVVTLVAKIMFFDPSSSPADARDEPPGATIIAHTRRHHFRALIPNHRTPTVPCAPRGGAPLGRAGDALASGIPDRRTRNDGGGGGGAC